MTTIQPTEIVGRAFAIYKQQAGALIPAALVVFAVVALSELVFDEGLLVLIASAIGIVAHTFYTGMVVRVVDDVRDGVLDASVSSLFASVAPVALTLIVASLLVGIGVGIGFILLIVPGLFLMTIWAVVAPVVVLEQRGVIEALRRSQELVKGNGWGVFGVIVIVFLLTIGAGIVGGILSFAGGDVVRVLVTWAVTVLVAPLAALATSVLYFALRDQP